MSQVLLDEAKQDFRQGARDALPLWLGLIPFAIALSMLARSDGLTGVQTFAMSLFVFAGSAQLAIERSSSSYWRCSQARSAARTCWPGRRSTR